MTTEELYALEPEARNPEYIFECLDIYMNDVQREFCDLLLHSCSMEFIMEKLSLDEKQYEDTFQSIKDLQEKHLPGI